MEAKKKKKKKAGCLQKNQAFHLVKPLFYIPLQEENTQEVISQSSSLMKSYSLVPRGLTTKKLLRRKNIFGKIFRARSCKSPVSPHCLCQEWFSYKLRRPCQSERQTQILSPHLPKSSNDYVKHSTLSWVNKNRRTKMKKGRTCVFEVEGESKRAVSPSP